MVITHCDIFPAKEAFIKGKLEQFTKFGNIEIPEKNIIQFDNTEKSLKPLIEIIEEPKLHFNENLMVIGKRMLAELPNEFKKHDSEQGTSKFQEL